MGGRGVMREGGEKVSAALGQQKASHTCRAFFSFPSYYNAIRDHFKETHHFDVRAHHHAS